MINNPSAQQWGFFVSQNSTQLEGICGMKAPPLSFNL